MGEGTFPSLAKARAETALRRVSSTRMAKHHAVGIDAGTAEHVADADRTEPREEILQEIVIGGAN
jgi:hypothetical protein